MFEVNTLESEEVEEVKVATVDLLLYLIRIIYKLLEVMDNPW